MAKDVVAEIKAKLEGRLGELNEERQRLERALRGLTTATGQSSPPAAASPRKRRRKRARPGQRRQQFIDAVRGTPGITVGQIARRIGSAPNPLYALARQLLKDGEIEKDGSGYRIAKETAAKKPSRAKKAGKGRRKTARKS